MDPTFVQRPDPSAALSRLRRSESVIAIELANVQAAIAEIDLAMESPQRSASLMSVQEVAAELHVSRSRVFEMLKAGDLEGIKLGKERCVPRSCVESLISRQGAA
jgi:excisionase family DNA binding protein